MPKFTDAPQLTARFDDALAYTATLHRAQIRKGTRIPYISHLLAVASLALEHGADEDTAIAALLHDAVEDCGGEPVAAAIEARFGPRVAAIVRACSDAAGEPKPPWRQRKLAYLAHLRAERDPATLLVSASDKLHNARALLLDLRTDGPSMWSRFNAGEDGSLWYYREVVAALTHNPAAAPFAPLVAELARAVDALVALSAPSRSSAPA